MTLRIGDVFATTARAAPNQVAATLADRSLTFRELDEAANRYAHALQGRGISHGDRVCWWGETTLDVVPLFAALAKLGAVFAPLNARAGVREVQPVAGYARPDLVVAAGSLVEPGAEVARAIDVPLAHLGRGPGTNLAALAASAAPTPPTGVRVDERDPHVIFFTSGSTGKPKGVVLSHRVNWLRTHPGVMTTAGRRGVVCVFPLFHMAGWTIALGAWQARRAVHFVDSGDARTILAETVRHRADRMYCIPALWARILDHGVGGYDLSEVREADTGTSATPIELLHAIHDALPHTETRVFYGSTEAGAGAQLGPTDLFRKPGSVGLPQPGVEVKLVDGEVCLRSPFLMDGYFDNPAATRDALRDGWYHTGDLGALDEDGYLSIVGRARDLIRTGGETVAPGEVEEVLRTHPDVADVAVVGIADPQWGEVVCAVVVARGEAAPDIASLREHCGQHLASFKHPRRIEVVDALPRTPATGQVQRTLIVERLQAQR